jgi:two-component system NarL family response regulator
MVMASPIRVLLVDDHVLFREGLCSLLSARPDIVVIGEANDGLEALVMAQELGPDLILMDVTMPGCDGFEATQRIKEILPDARIVMLTVHDDDERLFEAIRSGAMGYILKSTAAETLVPKLRAAMRGEPALGQGLAARILTEFARLANRAPDYDQGTDIPVLTRREKQVLELIVANAMDKDIAKELSVSLSTVKAHVRNILSKLHATSRYEAAAYAVRKGLIRPSGGGAQDKE